MREGVLLPGPGNAAFSRLRDSVGVPLIGRPRVELERAFGASLRDVRVHDDARAHDAAAAAGAEAFAHGDDVYLAKDAPPLATAVGRRLLAHELAHVLQQRDATPGVMTAPHVGDAFEAAADEAARRVDRGESAAADAVAGAPPAVQFQFKHNAAGRPEVEHAVRAFLESALAAQGGTRLELTDAVRNALGNLARAPRPGVRGTDPGAIAHMDMLLAKPSLVPRDPPALAKRVAAILPSPFDRATLERLRTTPAGHAPPSVGFGEVVDKTATPELEPPPGPTAEATAERTADVGHAMIGEERPTTYGPVALPVLRIGRIIHGLSDVGERSEPPKTAPPAVLPAKVRQVVNRTAKDALLPARAAGAVGAAAGRQFPDARRIAAELARRVELGRRSGQKLIELRLPASYSNVKDQENLRQQVEAFVERILAAFPARGRPTPSVDVFFGKRWASRVD